MRIASPPLNVAAQYDTSLPFIVGGLVLLLIIALVIFWWISRKPPAAPDRSETPDETAQPIAAPPKPAVLSLEFVAESGQNVSVTLDKPTLTIGRASDNDIVLAAPIRHADSASLHHARLRRDHDEFIVRDLGSRNGLAVNGRQTIENLLHDGDQLRFGEVEAIFHQTAGGAA
jgi:pSer/pThr/pTyr-binding forkhead associated (FHA) protein